MIIAIIVLIVIILTIWMLNRAVKAIEHWQETRAAVKVHTVVRPRAEEHTKYRIRANTEGAHRTIDQRWGKLFSKTKAQDDKVLHKIGRRIDRGEPVPRRLIGRRQQTQTALKAITESAIRDHRIFDQTSRSYRTDPKTGQLKPGVRRAGHNNEGGWTWTAGDDKK